MPEKSCEIWSLQDWNSALLEYVFGHTTNVVSVIPISYDFFENVTGEALEDGVDGKEVFLGLFRNLSNKEFQRLFDPVKVFSRWNSSEKIPPFFAQLVLTLVTAADLEASEGIGDFRIRIRNLVGFEEEEHAFPFSGLAEMWRALRDWLANARGWAPLELPDPGNQVRIGYSKKLAFPGYRDANELIRLVGEKRIDMASTWRDIASAIHPRLGKFSEPFVNMYRDFEKKRNSEPPSTLYSHPFWSSFAAISIRTKSKPGKNELQSIFTMHLSLMHPWNPKLRLLIGEKSLQKSQKDLARPLRIGRDEWWILRKEEWIRSLTENLEAGSTLEVFPNFRESWIYQRIIDGCLAFPEDEYGGFIAKPFVDTVDDNLLLSPSAWNRLTELIGEALSRDLRAIRLKSCEWRMVSGLGKVLAGIDSENLPFKCLKPVAVYPRIAIRGVLDTGAFVFTTNSKPIIYCESASSILVSVGRASGGKISLVACKSRVPGEFEFPFDFNDCLNFPNELTLEGFIGETKIAKRQIRVVRQVTDPVFRSISNPEKWLVESKDGHLLPMAEARDLIPRRSIGLDLSGIQNPRGKLLGSIRQSHNNKIHPIQSVSLGDESSSWKDFCELCTAISCRRAGLSTFEIEELFLKCYPDIPEYLASDFVSSLEGNSVFIRCQNRHWKGVRFFPFAPRFFKLQIGRTEKYFVVGLLSESGRKMLCAACQELGIQSEYRIPTGAINYNQIRLMPSDRNSIGLLSERLKWPILSATSKEFALANPLQVVLSRTRAASGESPATGETFGFNPNTLRFEPEFKSHSGWSLSKFQYGDRASEYLLSDESGRTKWVTLSRNWGILAYSAMTGTPLFFADAGMLSRKVSARGIWLPSLYAKACAFLGRGESGPTFSQQDGWSYLYPFGEDAHLRELFSETNIKTCQEFGNALARWRSLTGPEKSAASSHHLAYSR